MTVLVALWFSVALAGTADDAYKAGIDHARAGDHQSAAEAFVEALEAGGRDPAVYHGLGNALWRLNQLGPATTAWRRGLRLSPRNGDIAANLDRARRTSEDRIEAPTPTAEVFFWQSVLSPRDSAWLASLLATLAFAAPWVRRWRRSERRVGLETPLMLLPAAVLVVSTYTAVVNQDSVVVVVPEVSCRSALGPDGVELFLLHEGSEVRLAETHRDHHLVVLPDERKGWLPASATLSTNPSAPFPRTVLLREEADKGD